MTKEQIKDMVLTHTNRDDKVSLIYSAIELGLKQINMRWSFKLARIAVDIDVVENQRTIDLPSDALQLVALRIKDTGTVNGAAIVTILPKYRLRELEPRLADLTDDDSTRTGKPVFAYEEGGQILLVPAADNAYTFELEYDVIESLDEVTDQSRIPNIDEALIAYATSYVYKSIQMLTDAQFWDKEFEKAFRVVKNADSRRTAQNRQMRGSQMHGSPKIDNRDYRINEYTPS